MQKLRTVLIDIWALASVLGVFLLPSMTPGISLAESADTTIGTPLSSSMAPSRVTPAMREILQKNDFQAAQYKTPAPDFELQDLDGKTVRLSQFRGKIVLLGFFTTW